MSAEASAPRLAPELALPPYGFVPGRFPHPHRDPRGHRHGAPPSWWGPPPELAGWRASRHYLHALDLFNAGYYWEAHEGLEAWWRALPAGDPRHLLLHGLLRLAAAGVKAREGRPAGVRKHALRAAELLRAAGLGNAGRRLLGLDPAALARAAESAAADAERLAAGSCERGAAEPLLGVTLVPEPPA